MEFAEVRDGLKEKSFVLVDVRNPEELQAAGKIPGSVNVPREFPELRLCHQFIFIVYLTLNLLKNYFNIMRLTKILGKWRFSLDTLSLIC